MKNEYVIKTTDGSFDYNAPWGTATHHCTDIHGFEYDMDEGLESLNGFGDYSYLDNFKDNAEDLITELDLILLQDYEEYSPEVTYEEAFEELMEHLRELALKGAA